MIFSPTCVVDAFVIDVERREDERGFLARTYCVREFADHGIVMPIVQSSTVVNPWRDTLRGLHFQRAPYAERKLIRCTRGSAYVVIVDLRPESATWLDWTGVELTAANERLLYVPQGFAQGYQTLEDDTEVLYHMSHEYVPEAATGVRFDDPAFGVAWPSGERRLISERDRSWPDYEVPSAGAQMSGAFLRR
jgi:dTDP-4-dehydrorhamnose 3,5-epimerase